MAPVTPDSSLPGAVDAHRVAPHLDKVDSSRTETRQPARGLVPDVIYHLREGKEAGGVTLRSHLALEAIIVLEKTHRILSLSFTLD